uniref:CC domain-containing protein n=1 Tax=Caenorhabditis tropicalis TaxID=1561998 RepID=A0A1I7TPU7_9PELO
MASSSLSYVLILSLLIAICSSKSTTEVEIVGPCVNSHCPHTYECKRNECIRDKPKARPGTVSIGPCINTQCPVGHFCLNQENQCYPSK